MKPQISRIAPALALALTAAAALLAGPIAAQAQNLFAPVITVNDKAITGYELEQREQMLRLFRAPGDASELARDQLIEERLKTEAAETAGIDVTQEGIEAGYEEFAGRADMTVEQFRRALDESGVAQESFRDFVRNGVLWRELVRARFGNRVQITDTEIDRALNAISGGNSVRVLLSEIIMPAPSAEAQTVMQRAERISQITSTDAFSSEARRYSAASTRDNGGRMDWIALTELPAQLRPVILALAPGEVTDPLPLDGAVALFQMRAIQETDVDAPTYSEIEYAAYYIDGGRSDAALDRAAKIRAEVDTCDDLYGVAKGQPPEVLEREARAPSEIPQDIAVELAKLDANEVSTTLTRQNGQALMLLMLCSRTPDLGEEVDREGVRNQLRAQRLESYAERYLAQLRADARIIQR